MRPQLLQVAPFAGHCPESCLRQQYWHRSLSVDCLERCRRGFLLYEDTALIWLGADAMADAVARVDS